ncbi:MAG: nitroreductase family deazaflavin-dependent oxidoreductase [Acidimicrobiia bacterium]
MSDYNQRVVAEFRANGGKMGGHFQGAPMLLLHSIGARSGEARVTPLMYQPLDGGAVAVFASNNGADTNPAWYYNLLAHPEVEIEIGSELLRVRGRVADGGEREEIWERQKQYRQAFAEYETMTERQIPVVILEF